MADVMIKKGNWFEKLSAYDKVVLKRALTNYYSNVEDDSDSYKVLQLVLKAIERVAKKLDINLGLEKK